jgi:hypothetical protein
VQEVLGAPAVAVPVGRPLLVDGQQGQVVRVVDEEFLAGCVGFFESLFRAVEDRGDGEHADDCEHFFAAVVGCG